MGRIAIGDIHGCVRALEKLLEKLALTPDDHLIFLGDYIDRGPDSKGVIERLLALDQTHRCTFLRGNHEALMLDFLDHGKYDLWYINGGATTLTSYVENNAVRIPSTHEAFIRRTELYYEDEDFFYVHAGLNPHLTIEENKLQGDENIYLWERSHFQASFLRWEKPVVCGHTPQSEPLLTEKLICIDTGCVYAKRLAHGRLCGIRLPSRDLVMVGCT